MTSPDVPDRPLVQLLRRAFGSLIEAGEVDLVTLPERDETEIQADHWTLHLEGWPIVTAWVAIDQDPVSVAEQLAALRDAFDQRAFAAFRDADGRLDGALLRSMRESGDELSVTLAGLVVEFVSPPE